MQYNVHDVAKKAKRRLHGQKDDRPRVSVEKVRAMLDGEVVADPLGRLTDRAVFDALDDIGRQRYILELATSYNRCLEQLCSRGNASSGY